jgi:hypothetical protein
MEPLKETQQPFTPKGNKAVSMTSTGTLPFLAGSITYPLPGFSPHASPLAPFCQIITKQHFSNR